MKKLFYSLFILAMTAMTFTSCEDVPAPFDIPFSTDDPNAVVIDPAGSGTLADPYNVAAVIAFTQQLEPGTESTQDIYFKGKVVSIDENYTTQYGNAKFYVSDDGTANNRFLVYRALYLGNKKYTSGDLLNEGDEVIICGKVTNYNGTLETQQNKAFLYSLNGKTESGGGSDKPAGDAKGSGTLADPYNPVGANNYTSSLGSDQESPNDIYIKGKISRIANNGEFSSQYGNASFYISEDGTESGEFYVFRTKYLGNQLWKDGDAQIKVGDEVIICGKVVNYKGNTPETSGNKSYIYSLNGKTDGGGTPTPPAGDAKGSGTLADPYNPVAANNYTSSLAADKESDKDVYIKGIISRIANNGTFNTQYGNASFYISEDGKESGEFYVFRTLYLGNVQWTDGCTQIKVGDEVIICGKVVNYKGNTPETAGNKSYIYSLNGKTEGGGGGSDTPDTPTGKGSYSDPYDVPGAIAANSGTGVYIKAYIVGYVEGQVLTEGAHFTAEGCNVKSNMLIAASASETDISKCMPVQLPNGDVRTGLNLQDNPGNIKKEVLLYGNIEKYFGAPGVKAVTYAEIDGKNIGTKP